MTVGGHEVVTPQDDPVFYDLAWRLHVAEAAAPLGTTKLPLPVRNDGCVTDWIRYIRNPSNISQRRRGDYARVTAWMHGSPLTSLLTAFLLTGADYATIAGDFPELSPGLIRLYEQSVFNVRASDGALRPIHLLRIRFQQRLAGDDIVGAELMRAALAGGYPLVKTLWGDNDAADDELAKTTLHLVGRELSRRVLQGRVDTRDLIRLRQVANDTARLRHEMEKTSTSANEGWDMVRELLELMAPTVVDPRCLTKQLAGRMSPSQKQAERAIGAQPIRDRGPVDGVHRMQAEMREHVARNT